MTQGGTSSSALFRVFINDLREENRKELNDIGELQAEMGPVRLVADDLAGVTQTLRGLQVLLKVCESWAIRNGLKWNPTKSQVLRVNPAGRSQDAEVKLDGVKLNFIDVIEYLGLQLAGKGFTGKIKSELLDKCTSTLQLMLNEPWFSMALRKKHISRAYKTYVRSIMLYGAELLSHEDWKPVYDLDSKRFNMMLGRLLKLGRGRLG